MDVITYQLSGNVDLDLCQYMASPGHCELPFWKKMWQALQR